MVAVDYARIGWHLRCADLGVSERLDSFSADERSGSAVEILLGFFAVLFTVAGGIGQIKNRRTLSLVESRLEMKERLVRRYSDDVEKVLRFALLKLAEECSLVERDRCKPHLQITLYCHDPENQRFIPVARIAGNPIFEQPGRGSYPDSQGVISQGWARGMARFETGSSGADWVAEVVAAGFDQNTAKQLRMQSKSMLALRVEESGRFAGVIVIESMNKTGVTAGLRKQLLDASWYESVASLVGAVQGSHVTRLAQVEPA